MIDAVEILDRIERQLAVEPRHVGQAAVRQQQRVAVGRRFRDRVHADDAAGAAAVVDHDGLAEARGQRRAQHARDGADRAAGRERHDQADRFRRIVVGAGRRRAREQRAEQQQGPHFHFSRLTLVTWLPAAPIRANRLGHGLDRHRHVEGVGVDHAVAAARDGDVAFPENQVAALQAGEACRLAERALLHVAVARAFDAAGRQRDLHQPRAVEAEARLAAPEIGHADETARPPRRNPARHCASGTRCRFGTIAAGRRDGEAVLLPRHGDLRAERQRVHRRQLDRRAGEHEGPQRRDLVGRLRRPARAAPPPAASRHSRRT